MSFRFSGLLLFVLFSAPYFASAQLIGGADIFSVTYAPLNPSPFSSVVVTPLSSRLDLTNAEMTIMSNGKEVYVGNAKPTGVSLGASGTLSVIKIIITSDGKSYTQTLNIRPQDVALVIEPVSSAPALYLGKPNIPLEGNVRVTAMANLRSVNGATINPATLSYAWVVDATQIVRGSGIGKDTLLVASPNQYRSRDISVRVQSQDGSVSGGASVSITPRDPIVRIYENDPLLGILFDRALTNTFSISSTEKTLYGAPFSFSTKSGPPRLQWFLNGSSAQTGTSITLRPTGSGKGSSSLSLVGSTEGYTTASSKLSITFGEERSGFNLFGL